MARIALRNDKLLVEAQGLCLNIKVKVVEELDYDAHYIELNDGGDPMVLCFPCLNDALKAAMAITKPWIFTGPNPFETAWRNLLAESVK